MLNDKTKLRELAYVVSIDEIRPIEGADRVELAIVGGWQIMVRKNQFQIGDPAIYFEIDSRVPEIEAFEFLAQRHYKVKTQKFFKGQVISQGLLMHAEDFGWDIEENKIGIIDDEEHLHLVDGESRFLTEKLGVKYAEDEDNARKANSPDKYKRMAQRHPQVFKKPFVRWLMRREWGKKLLFVFFGRQTKKNGWPNWVQKTDEERCQNLTQLLFNGGAWSKETWIATEKVDGTSTTFTLKRGRGFHKDEFYVCSRNVVFDTPDKPCFYDSNCYFEMAQKYEMKEKMKYLLEVVFPEVEWVTIQAETFGAGIQKRDYSLAGHDMKVFNLITSDKGRINTLDMIGILNRIDIPCVPVVNEAFTLPNTIEELLAYAEGVSAIDGKEREGIVFRSLDATKSFKAVSNSFLIKYHQ